MKVAAVIAEYNPFHNGHLYHLNETKRSGASHIIAVMSGSFTQRGEPALFTKFKRASAAIKNGADLVIELPVRYSLSSSQHFAEGAISIIKSIGCVDLLSFGCECSDIGTLQNVVNAISDRSVLTLTKQYYQSGMKYPDARSKALRDTGFSFASDILSGPNNLLAVEYLKALGSGSIKPLAVKRIGSGHDDTEANAIPSASFIRSAIRNNNTYSQYVPSNSVEIYSSAINAGQYYVESSLDLPLLFKLRELSRTQLCNITDCRDGLGDRIFNASRSAGSISQLLQMSSTKRYTVSRIRRALMNAFIGIKGYDFPPVPYARILAIGPGGKDILNRMKHTCSIPFSGSFKYLLDSSGSSGAELLSEEARATDIHSLLLDTIGSCGTDYSSKLINGV